MIEHRKSHILDDNKSIEEYVLKNNNGMSISILTLGGIVKELCVVDKNGEVRDVVLGFDRIEDYLEPHPYFGAIIGRVAGRIKNSSFSLNGQQYVVTENEGDNHLHGGSNAFDKQIWQAKIHQNKLILTHSSADGDEGYPGNVEVEVSYTLSDSNEFSIEYQASTDKATPLSLTNHSYFNLMGNKDENNNIYAHQLTIYADYYTAFDDDFSLLPVKEKVTNENDFRQSKRLSDAIPKLHKEHGDNYFINPTKLSVPKLVAEVSEGKSGISMKVYSTEQCMQFYTGVSIDSSLKGKGEQSYKSFSGLCLECQGYPEGINYPELGNIILSPDKKYQQRTIYQFFT